MSKKRGKITVRPLDLPGIPNDSISIDNLYHHAKQCGEAMRLSKNHVEYYHIDKRPDSKCRICRSLKKTILKGF